MMQRAHKIRLYPNKAQSVILAKTAGTSRYAYNWGIEKWEDMYHKGELCGAYTLSKMWVQERPAWTKEVGAQSIQHALLDVEKAYTNFFRRNAKHPTFKKKGFNDRFYVSNQSVKFKGKRIMIPKAGYVKMSEKFRYNISRILFATVFCKAGNWYVSIQCEIPSEVRTESTTVVGVDVGISNWAVASDGTVCKSPGSLKHWERVIRRRHRLLDRKAKASNNRARARIELAKAYEKANNIKLDTIHKFTAAIAKNHGVVVVEALNIEDMKKTGNKGVRQGVQASMMSEILRQLEYKCNRTVVVDRYFPSSKTCSNCGNVKDDLTLSNRTYKCTICGHTMDRDMNAAVNLLHEGLKIISGGSHR